MEIDVLGWLTGLLSGIGNDYLVSLVILVLFAIVAKVLLFLFGLYLKKVAKKTKTVVDDLIFENTRQPIFYLVLVYGLKLALENIGWEGVVTNIVNSLLVVVFVLIFSRGLDVIIEKKTKTTIDEVLLPLFHKASHVIFVIIAVMWVLRVWKLDITPYLAGVGVGGLVLGFALQDSLKNIFGGITLVLDKTFRVGDKIKLESGDVGEIHDIGLRSTKLVTYDNEVIYIPNGYLANSRVQNYTRPSPKVRVVVDFGVEYGSPVEKVKKVVLSELKKMEGILSDPSYAVDFVSMGDSALQFQAKFWVEKWDMAYG